MREGLPVLVADDVPRLAVALRGLHQPGNLVVVERAVLWPKERPDLAVAIVPQLRALAAALQLGGVLGGWEAGQIAPFEGGEEEGLCCRVGNVVSTTGRKKALLVCHAHDILPWGRCIYKQKRKTYGGSASSSCGG